MPCLHHGWNMFETSGSRLPPYYTTTYYIIHASQTGNESPEHPDGSTKFHHHLPGGEYCGDLAQRSLWLFWHLDLEFSHASHWLFSLRTKKHLPASEILPQTVPENISVSQDKERRGLQWVITAADGYYSCFPGTGIWNWSRWRWEYGARL
jgi:hypothetical protein